MNRGTILRDCVTLYYVAVYESYAMWNVVAENDAGEVVLADGKYRVYEKTTYGTTRVGIYDSENVAMDVFGGLSDND